MSDVTPTLRNLTDIHFLPGFHSPTVAFLYAPVQTWAGRLHTARDTFVVEVRTFDLASTNSYPLLTKAEGLPSDSQYMVPAPKELGGVVVVTTSGIIHVDQTGNRVATSVNGWFSHTSRNPHSRHCEHLCLTLEGSKAIFISEKDMLLTLVTGRVHHVRFVIDGRTVSKVTVEPEAQGMRVPCASSFASSGIARATSEDGEMLFVGCAEGDSSLLRARLIPREEEGAATTAPADLMEVDDEDGELLLCDHANQTSTVMPLSPLVGQPLRPARRQSIPMPSVISTCRSTTSLRVLVASQTWSLARLAMPAATVPTLS